MATLARSVVFQRNLFLNACSSQDWVTTKPGAKNGIQVSQIGGKDPTTLAITAASLGVHKHKSGNGNWYGMNMAQVVN